MAKRPRIPRRKRYFVGCEGESEQGYAALLQRFANEARLSIHIDAKVLSTAGDPLALVERAATTVIQGERGSKPPFVGRFVLLDTDRIGQNLDRDAKMFRVANAAELILVRQDCCFEAFLLRHFEGRENDRPPNAGIALNKVLDAWPDYRKGTSAQELAKRLTLEDVRRAAANPLNLNFKTFLVALGLMD